MKRKLQNCALISVTVALVLAASPIRAETLRCQEVASLPATIDAPGIYCLKRNLSVTGPLPGIGAITINANNVVLDLNGFALRG
jgi:hypothetical protein